jgi:hypothetical protein
MTTEIEMIELYNKGNRSFMGTDLDKAYVFKPDSKMKFSKSESDKLCKAYPTELVSFDAVMISGVAKEIYDKEVEEHKKTNVKLSKVEKELQTLKDSLKNKR